MDSGDLDGWGGFWGTAVCGDLGCNGTTREASADLLTGLDFGCGTEQGFFPLRVGLLLHVDEGVATIEHGQRRQGFQASGELVETNYSPMGDVAGVASEGDAGVGEAMLGAGETNGRGLTL